MRTVHCSSHLEGVAAQGVSARGCLPGGVCLGGGGVCLEGVHLPPVDRQTPVKT